MLILHACQIKLYKKMLTASIERAIIMQTEENVDRGAVDISTVRREGLSQSLSNGKGETAEGQSCRGSPGQAVNSRLTVAFAERYSRLF